MLRKTIINSVLQQSNTDEAFENEAVATFIEGEITNKLSEILTEQDILNLEKLPEEAIYKYLIEKIPTLEEIISEETKRAKEKFKKQLAV